MELDVTYKDFGVICRICLDENKNMQWITALNIATMIEACSSVHISDEDDLPKQVCQNCVKRLEDAYQLKELCELSDARLREIAEKKPDLELNDVKVELVDDEMCLKEEVKEEYFDNDSCANSYTNNTENDTADDEDEKKDRNKNTIRKIAKKYNTNQHKCEQCNKILDGVWRLALHMRKKHKVKPQKCEKCDQQFYHPLHLEEHLNNHDQNQLTCKHCNKQYATLAKLKKHQVAHRPEMFHCFKCDSSFKGRFMLNKHEQIYHSGSRPREECKICGKSVIQTNMVAHMKIHQDRVPFECDECPKKFVRKITLKEHIMKIHRNEEIPLKQLCNICGRGFRGKSELRRHMRSHTGEKPFQCEACEKRYRESKALRRHFLSAHMDQRPFSCSVCAKAFHTKAILQAHMRTHTGERPYSCLICNKAFGSKTWLKAHIKAHND